jgi:hypothetical protein
MNGRYEVVSLIVLNSAWGRQRLPTIKRELRSSLNPEAFNGKSGHLL